MIQVQIDLTMYGPYQIIQLAETGVITIDELIESGAAFQCFTNILHNYVRTRIKRMEKTAITNHTVMDLGLAA